MHPSWALLSIGSIIAPFYSSYVPFINYLVRSNNLENRFFLKVFAILPLIIPLNFIIDLFFTILGIFYPIVIFVLNLPVRLVAVFMLLFTCFKSKTGKDWFYNGYFTNKAEKYNH